MASSNRFLTTHIGSLPRPEELMQIMFAREDGIPLDQAALEEKVTTPLNTLPAGRSRPESTSSTTGRCPSRATQLTSRTG
jgi:hypothetical protein